MLLHCKLSPNLVAYNNNKSLLSHSFCGLGTREWLGWVVLAWMWSALWRILPQVAHSRAWLWVGGHRAFSLGLCQGCLSDWLPLQRVIWEKERHVEGRCLFYDNLRSRGISVCHVLFVRRDSLKSSSLHLKEGSWAPSSSKNECQGFECVSKHDTRHSVGFLLFWMSLFRRYKDGESSPALFVIVSFEEEKLILM